MQRKADAQKKQRDKRRYSFVPRRRGFTNFFSRLLVRDFQKREPGLRKSTGNPKYPKASFKFENHRLGRLIVGSVTYSNVRTTRSSPLPKGVTAWCSLSPLKKTNKPGSVERLSSRISRPGSLVCKRHANRLKDQFTNPSNTV